MKKVARRGYSIFFISVFAMVHACSLSTGLPELQNIEKRWKDGVSIAEKTPRIAAASQISNLQGIKRDLDALSVSSCLNEAKGHLSKSMESEITSMLNFMEQKDYLNIYTDTDTEFKLYETSRDKCK